MNHYQIAYTSVMFWPFGLAIRSSKKIQNGSYVPLHIGKITLFSLHIGKFNMDHMLPLFVPRGKICYHLLLHIGSDYYQDNVNIFRLLISFGQYL